MLGYEPKPNNAIMESHIKIYGNSYKATLIFTSVTSKWGPVAQHGWSVRLIIERSAVQIRLGPPLPLNFAVKGFMLNLLFFFRIQFFREHALELLLYSQTSLSVHPF
jgi:hypothetical protein